MRPGSIPGRPMRLCGTTPYDATILRLRVYDCGIDQ